jgi:hypothetical protein
MSAGTGDDSDMGPAAVSDEFRAHDVVAEARTFAVVVTVIPDGDHDFLPTHIEEITWIAEIVDDGNLRSRPREPGTNEQQPQPGLARRLRSGVVNVEDRTQLG